MFKPHLLVLISFFCLTSSWSQQGFTKEIGIETDNDLYVSTYRDRYYSSGVFLYYKKLASKNTKPNRIKKISTYKLNQELYTPNHSNSPTPDLQDRPYAGYTYFSYANHTFFKKPAALKTTFEVGVLGPASGAQEIQNWIHNLYGFMQSSGWDYQIQNTFGLNINAEYTKRLGKKKNRVDLIWDSHAKLGTIKTQIKTGVFTRINLSDQPLNPISNSVLLGSNLNHLKKEQKKEFFFYFKPVIGIAIFDATIQGNLFKWNSPVTYPINSFILEGEFGLKYSSNRFDISYEVHTYKKRLESMIDKTNTYGSIRIAYKFN